MDTEQYSLPCIEDRLLDLIKKLTSAVKPETQRNKLALQSKTNHTQMCAFSYVHIYHSLLL